MNQLRQLLAIAGFALAAALFAVPADEARAHNVDAADFHFQIGHPLHGAAAAGDVYFVNHFLAAPHSKDVNERKGSLTPLHAAAGASSSTPPPTENSRVSVVLTLLAKGADVNAKDSSGWTPLHHAAIGGYASIIAALTAEEETEVDLTDNFGVTPLYWAAGSGHYDGVVALAEAGADVTLKSDSGETPLHWAARSDRRDIVVVLVAAGADVNATDNSGKTPLHNAVDMGHSSVARLLILLKGRYGEACANGFVVNPAGSSPPCVCPANKIAADGACEIAAVCDSPSERDPDTNGCDCPAPNIGPDGAAAPGDCVASCGGLTPFHDVAAGLCVPLAECAAPLVLNTTTNQCGCPAGYDAVNDECVCPPEHGVLADGTCGACPAKQFVQGGVCVAPGADSCGRLTPAKFYDSAAVECVALAECAAPAVRDAGTNRCDCPAPNIGADGAAAPGDCHGESALHAAAGAGDLVSVNYLIAAHMADVNATVSGETPLHAAAGNGHVSVVLTLLAEGAAVNGKDNGGLTPLRWAAFRDHAAVVAALIAEGGHYGEACASPAVVNPAGPDPSCVCESPNVGTPDNCAAPGADSCGRLIPAKFYDSAADACVALAECAAPAVRDAGTNRCDCPAPNIGADGAAAPGDCHGESALHAAAGAGDLVFVNYLIAAHMADVNATVSGETPLHAAAVNGHVSVVLTLLAEGAAVNGKDNGGLTPLRWAAFRDHAAVVAALIAEGGHYGDACASPAVVNPAGPDPSCVCESPNVGTPDNCAAPGADSCGRLTPAKFYDSAADACVALAECAAPAVRGAGTNRCDCPAPNIGADGAAAPGDCHGEDALHAAAGAGDLVSVNYLIAAHMADVNATVSGETPLHAAARNGHVSVVLTLLAEGANVNVKSGNVRTPGWTPLHYAAGNGHVSVVLTLLARRAEVNAKDNAGLTPLRWADVRHRMAKAAATGGGLTSLQGADVREYFAVVAALLAAGGHYGEACISPAVVNPAGPVPPCVCQSPNVDRNGVCFPESGDLDDLEDLRAGGVSDKMLCGGFGGTVQVAAGGEEVCSGMDANDTFCIIDSTDAFPCRGLFKHLWNCNMRHNRPALNPFLCGAECEAREKAVGKSCAAL